jgi:hypothetical protein
MKKVMLLAILLVCIASVSFAAVGKYQISTAEKGVVYMVDTETGKLWLYNASLERWVEKCKGLEEESKNKEKQ